MTIRRQELVVPVFDDIRNFNLFRKVRTISFGEKINLFYLVSILNALGFLFSVGPIFFL